MYNESTEWVRSLLFQVKFIKFLRISANSTKACDICCTINDFIAVNQQFSNIFLNFEQYCQLHPFFTGPFNCYHANLSPIYQPIAMKVVAGVISQFHKRTLHLLFQVFISVISISDVVFPRTINREICRSHF